VASTCALTWSKLGWGPKLQKGQYLGAVLYFILLGVKIATS